MNNLTPKQEKFCLLYMECGNASEAYRKTYDTKSDKPETANRLAKQLLDNIKIASRIDELRGRLVKKSLGTVESLIDELEESRKLAIDNCMPAPAVSATMGKAKLLGLDVQKLNLSSADGSMSPPKRVEISFVDAASQATE